MKFWRNKKIIFGVLAGTVVSGMLVDTRISYAADSGGGVISWVAEVAVIMTANAIVYILGVIGSALYTFFAGLIDLALQVNALILSSPVVLKGWEIVLSFTNLGFVLAIIVIAFATIFRVESYAMKQVLWKLIVAALLVNFSLVIAGAFINVADTVTETFNSKLGTALSNGLTQILQPQALVMTKDETQKMALAETYSRRVLKTIDGLAGVVNWVTGSSFGSSEIAMWGDDKKITSKGALELILMLFFPVVFTFLSALTLLAVAVMLFIRYFVLGILLILSPIVWLLWIFPGTQSLWQKWWNNFLRWTFFAPIMMFFLYLAIASTGGDLKDTKMQESIEKSQAFTSELAKKQEGFAADIALFGNSVLVIGLILAGLIAANSMGIYGSKMAMGAAQGAGKWAQGAVGKAGGWAGRKTYEKTAGRALGSEKVKGWTEKLASSKFIGARLLGTGLNRLGMKSEALMQNQYKDLAKGMTPDRLNNEILASRGAKRAALIKEAANRKDINMEKLAPILNNPEEMGKIFGDLKRTGLNFKDVEKAVGRSFEMMTAKTDEGLMAATDKFVQSLTPKDFAKGQWDGVFKKTDDPRLQNMQSQLASSFAQYEHGAYSKIQPNIKTENVENFTKIMEAGIEKARKKAMAISDIEISAKTLAYVSKASERLNKSLDRRAMFGEEAWTPSKAEEV